MVTVVTHALERRIGIEDAAAARAKHVPRHLHGAELRGMQQRRDGVVRVEAAFRRKAQRVDPRKALIGPIADQGLQCLGRDRVGRLAQGGEKRVAVLHGITPRARNRAANPTRPS